MCEERTEPDLRAAWQRLRLVGDFNASTRRRAVRRVLMSALRSMQARERVRSCQCRESSKASGND
ncbi:hypothetical protein C9I57_17965 [Trinickia symbiotica]|uniref:Uncharacterized protein n=1 Tax=Trinickia symbiotica TaxID=863227 RepID=A0A2T3XSQ9_9BURK|nr:hypothetical protein [Trinickia symbiotica]PTB19566.1 hypothetical protein C9I57_17965 [Trinickia symbiotica]